MCKRAIDEFLLSCKVEGKSYGTIECYSDKLKGFHWYASNYHWPDDIKSFLLWCCYDECVRVNTETGYCSIMFISNEEICNDIKS